MTWFYFSKICHILSVILLLGNLIVSLWWRRRAFSSGEVSLMRFAVNQTILSDFVLTGVAVTCILVTGVANVEILGLGFHGSPWLMYSAGVLVGASGYWLAVLVPLQAKQSSLINTTPFDEAERRHFFRLERYWLLGRAVLIASFLVPILLMVSKPSGE